MKLVSGEFHRIISKHSKSVKNRTTITDNLNEDLTVFGAKNVSNYRKLISQGKPR
jgi:hypothetical protein